MQGLGAWAPGGRFERPCAGLGRQELGPRPGVSHAVDDELTACEVASHDLEELEAVVAELLLPFHVLAVALSVLVVLALVLADESSLFIEEVRDADEPSVEVVHLAVEQRHPKFGIEPPTQVHPELLRRAAVVDRQKYGVAGTLDAGPGSAQGDVLPEQPYRDESCGGCHRDRVGLLAHARDPAYLVEEGSLDGGHGNAIHAQPLRDGKLVLRHRESRVRVELGVRDQGHWQSSDAADTGSVEERRTVPTQRCPSGDRAVRPDPRRLLEDPLLDDVVVDVARHVHAGRCLAPPPAPGLTGRWSTLTGGVDTHGRHESCWLRAPRVPSMWHTAE